jgi:transposase
LSHERSDIAGAEGFHSLEGNMCGTVMRGADALPGSKATSRAKGSHRNLGDLVSGRCRRVLCVYGGPHWEGEEPKPMMHGHEKSDLAIVAMKPANKAKEAHCGGVCGGERSGDGGAKGGGQGEYAPAQHVLDPEPGSRDKRAGAYTATFAVTHPRWEKLWGGAAEVVASSSSLRTDGGCPVVQVNDLSRSLTVFDPISTLVVVVEMSKASWLVSGVIPGVERQPLKKLEPDATALLRLIERWRSEGVRAGRPIRRIALAYEAGRDGFWLARWLIARGIEAHVIHSASVAVSRERKRAKTDRLDAAMLMRVFLGWLRGERGHCGMVAIPTMEEEDARRPSRERECLVNERSRIINRMKSALARLGIRGFKPHLRRAPERLACLRTAEGTGLPTNIIEELRRDMARLALVREQITSIEKTRAERLERAPDTGPHAMVRLLSMVIGIGIETADMLVREILSRKLRDRRAVARYAGLTGSPDESGLKSREKGLAKAGNARVRRGLIQLAWRFLMFQKDSALARWYRTRTEGPSGARKTTMIVALARKLLIALWRLVTTGEIPDGVELRPAV